MKPTAVPPVKNLSLPSNFNRLFLGILVASLVLGTLSGFILAKSGKTTSGTNSPVASNSNSKTPATAQQDNKTFRDFAEGTIAAKPSPKEGEDYTEGTHMLVRQGAVPVALTSSVVDLSQYEGKKVKVFGETQKAVKEGWLMDVGKVEVE